MTFAEPDFLIDGHYTRPREEGPPRYEYPFWNNGDRVSGYFEQDYLQQEATFVPCTFKIEHDTLKGWFLIDETRPQKWQATLVRFTRTWSRIPAQQTIPGSRFVTKPDLPGTFPQVSGNSLIIQPEENVPRWVFYTNLAVTSDSGAPSGSSPTGGTWTITVNGETTSVINYNASAAAVQSALNALTILSAQGGVTVAGSYTSGFYISFVSRIALTANVGSLTGTGTAISASNSTGSPIMLVVDISPFPLNAADITGGTFTLTVFGQTTAAIAYNATTADVLAAVSALSNVSGLSVEVVRHTAQYAYVGSTIQTSVRRNLLFSVIIDFPTPTISGASLTPAGATAAISQVAPPFTQQWSVALTGILIPIRTLFSAAHGISVTDGIVLTQGANYRTLAAGMYAVPTADTITLTSTAGVAYSSGTLITFVGKATGSVYTAGTKLTRVKRVTDFYLPGVSAGVDTIDDIPLPTYEGDDASLLSAIFDGDTDINYEVGELELYRDGPIVQRTRTTLDATQL